MTSWIKQHTKDIRTVLMQRHCKVWSVQ